MKRVDAGLSAASRAHGGHGRLLLKLVGRELVARRPHRHRFAGIMHCRVDIRVKLCWSRAHLAREMEAGAAAAAAVRESRVARSLGMILADVFLK